MEDARRPLNRIYLDHAATTPLGPGVMDGMLQVLEQGSGNPSSVHAEGRQARMVVDAARDDIAAALRCLHRELIFTGSGTEADNLALRGVLERYGRERGRHLVVSAVEHEAVLATGHRLADCGVATLTVVPCDHSGVVSPDDVAGAVRNDTVCVSVMHVNNETGVIQDVAAIAEAVHRRNARTLVHSDCVQSFARIDVSPAELGLHLASFSAHKLGGPKGAGALWIRDGVAVAAQLTGGGQERGRRSGTENVAAIAGFAAAVRHTVGTRGDAAARQEQLAARLIESVCDGVPGARLASADAPRAPGIALFVVPGARSDVLLTALDRRGVAASGGSACSSGAPTPSHVLQAMGVAAADAVCALRVSLGPQTTMAEVDRAAVEIVAAVSQIRDAASSLKETVPATR